MRGINMSKKTSQTYRWQDPGDSGKKEPNDALMNKRIIGLSSSEARVTTIPPGSTRTVLDLLHYVGDSPGRTSQRA